jgi:release factor glutamine methyltransferase
MTFNIPDQETLLRARQWGTHVLHQRGQENPALDVRLLLAHALGISSHNILFHPERLLTPEETARFQHFIRRRQEGEPVSRILGHREFWSLDFLVTSATLDPRPDSETVVQLVLDSLPHTTHPWKIMDWGTGSGCLLLSILSHLPHAWGVGIDLSEAAVTVAWQNARHLANGERAESHVLDSSLKSLPHRSHFLVSHWGEALQGKQADLIVSNPPYIPCHHIPTLAPEVRLYDPWGALDGGASGLESYKALIPQAHGCLKPQGLLIMELGQGQATPVQALLENSGFQVVAIRPDLGGIDRAISARKV